MQESYLFEYAVIRLIPRVEREEFLNLGVIIYCSKLKFLKCIYDINADRIVGFSKDVELIEIADHLAAFKAICEGCKKGGPIAELDLASRFRWLTATRSTIFQTSCVHPGLTQDPEKTLSLLLHSMVL